MSEHYRVDAVIVGAGVVGLAVARALAMAGNEVVCIEQQPAFGMGTSSRNSEVIHAGIYYPAGSLKATLCVTGKHRLYAYCAQHDVPVQRCGKLIVAANDGQLAALETIRSRAAANGVNDLVLLNGREMHELEPQLVGAGALMSPSTGIIDSHAFMTQLLADLERSGGHLVCHTDVEVEHVANGRMRIQVGGTMPATVECSMLVNAAGLHAVSLMRGVAGFDAAFLPRMHFAKGNYFSYQGAVPFSRLIYPVPEPGGLGIHLTLDQQGRARFGPDVEWLTTEQSKADVSDDLQVDPRRAEAFAAAIASYWPEIDSDKLAPDYAGIRPKLSGPGAAAADFLIQGANQHGVQGLINLFGIESPGLTASMAIAKHVVARLTQENP